jgi:hypothetical protein
MKFYIYKIFKPDTDFLYIGSTNKFCKRKASHKKNTYNRCKPSYHRLLYKTIRLNGGWDSWTMEIIEFLEVETPRDGRIRELFYISTMNPNLNINSPIRHLNDDLVDLL